MGAVTNHGVVNIIHNNSEVRKYTLGFNVEKVSCEKNLILLCSSEKNHGYPIVLSFENGFPRHLVPRMIRVPCACESVLVQNDMIWMVLKNGSLRSTRATGNKDKWPIVLNNVTIKEAVETIAVISKKQALQKQEQSAMTRQLLDLNTMLSVHGVRDRIETKIQPVVHQSGIMSMRISIVNETGYNIGTNWCVVVGIDNKSFPFPVTRDVPSRSSFEVEVSPVILESYAPLKVIVWMIQMKSEPRDYNPCGLSFLPCSLVSMLLKQCTFHALDLSVKVDHGVVRSVVAKTPQPCIIHPYHINPKALKTFRFIGHNEHIGEIEQQSLESAFGSRINISVRPLSNPTFQEVIVSCHCEISEAISIRSAVLSSILSSLPSVLKVKVHDWKQAKHELKALQARLESCSSEELINIYNELRRTQLKF